MVVNENNEEGKIDEKGDCYTLPVFRRGYQVPLVIFLESEDDGPTIQADYQSVLQQYGYDNTDAMQSCREVVAEARVVLSERLGDRSIVGASLVHFRITTSAQRTVQDIETLLSDHFGTGQG